MTVSDSSARIRLAELVATLSLGTDLGLGQPMDHVLRQSLIALRLGERLGFDEDERAVLYFGGLLAWVGCHVDAYEQAKWFGDDIALKGDFRQTDGPGPAFIASHVGAGAPAVERVRTGLAFAAKHRGVAEDMLANHWRATDALATSLGLNDEVRATLEQTFERWDGKGSPAGRKGEEIRVASRLITLADVVEVYHRSGGVSAAVDVARRRSGSQFDPALVELFCACAEELFNELDDARNWDAVIALEPVLDRTLSEQEFDDALIAISDFTDLKSPWLIGHSRRVAELASTAAEASCEVNVKQVWRAALIQDVGRLGVSNAIWDKRGPLSHAETEQARLHVYFTERMLASSPALAPLGALAAMHHERLDGSGYPRGISATSIPTAARLLAAADVYCALTAERPHRGALASDEAAAQVRDEVKAGRLDGAAVEAVLDAAGHRARSRRDWPAGLTNREVEVLALLARGLSSKEIATRLVISPKTARNHIEHIYAKIEVSNRAMASMFAAKHGLAVEPYSDPTGQ